MGSIRPFLLSMESLIDAQSTRETNWEFGWPMLGRRKGCVVTIAITTKITIIITIKITIEITIIITI